MNEPKIRLKGFSGEWKNSLIKELCKITTGASNTQDQVVNGKYPFYIRSENVARSNRYLYNCEAVITIGDGNIGKVFHYVNGKFDLHQRCYMMYDFKNINAKYFHRVFSANFYDRVIKMSAKATVDSVRMDMIADMPIHYPSIDEQQAIADYFKHLDSLIQTTTKKIESLKQVKAASLQSMFPQEGETTPRIRFKGFQGEWKTSKYDEVFSLIGDTGHNVQKTEYCERGSYPIVDQSKEFIVGYTDIVQPIGGTNGLIIFGDHTREIKYIDFPFCTGADGTRILKSEETFDALFMYYVCHSLNIPNTGYNRHFKYIKEAIYKTPETKDEQTAIASYFQHLDSQITLQTQRLEKLKQIKSACLDNMFV